MVQKCPDCRSEFNENDTVCNNCGFPLHTLIKCEECGYKVQAGSVCCDYCGNPLKKKAKKPDVNIKKFLTLIACVFIVLSIVVGGATAVTSKQKNEFKAKLVEGGPWYELDTNAKIWFYEDGKVAYILINPPTMQDKSYGVLSLKTEYTVKSGEEIKIGNQKVKITLRPDGKIISEPDIRHAIENSIESDDK